eukprot:3187069-Rhodomonas_salina.2
MEEEPRDDRKAVLKADHVASTKLVITSLEFEAETADGVMQRMPSARRKIKEERDIILLFSLLLALKGR